MPHVPAILRGEGAAMLFKPSESTVAVFTTAIDGRAIPENVADGAGLDLDLDGCFEKLGRAQEHLELIDVLLRAFFESDPYGATSEVEREQGWHVFKIKVLREPPLRLGVIMGEYAHQIRSAFDHFAFALACAHKRGKRPKAVVGFPIKTSRTKYREAAAHRLKAHIPSDWATFIEGLQPYDAHNDPLAVLERFWNTDKHQTLVSIPTPNVSSVFARFYPHVAIKEHRPRWGKALKDSAEIARAKPRDPQPSMDVYCEASIEIRSEGTSSTDFVWNLILAEEMLRMILSAFESGRRDQERFQLSGRSYDTSITSLPGGIEEARRLGFLIHRDFKG